MSKRFGRNQKRRMREEIAEKEAAYMTTAKLMIYHRDKACENGRRVRELEDEIQDAKDVLGANFIGFRLTDEMKEHIRLIDMDQPFQYSLLPSRAELVKDALQTKAEVLRRVPLNVLAAAVDVDHYKAMMHFRLIVDGSAKAAYGLAINEIAFTPRHVLTKRLTEEFARFFVNEAIPEKKFSFCTIFP